MRENLFKAKRIDNGEWVEGSLIDLDIDSGYCYIVPPYKKASILPINFLITDRMKLVAPETLCQFTGLATRTGRKFGRAILFHTKETMMIARFRIRIRRKRFGKVFYQGFRLTFAIWHGKKWK